MNRTISAMLALIFIISLTSCGQTAPTWQEQYDLGTKYLSEGNYEAAVIAFTAAIEIDSKQVPAYVGRGDAHVGIASGKDVGESAVSDSYENAAADYLYAIGLDKLVTELYVKLADVYMALGNTDAARAILEQGYEATGDETLKEKLAVLPLFAPGEEVVWTDATLEQMVRGELGILDGPVYVRDLDYITDLTILGNTHIFINDPEDVDWSYRHTHGRDNDGNMGELFAFYGFNTGDDQLDSENAYKEKGNIRDIESLQYFQNLQGVNIIANHVSNISVLARLPKLGYAIFFANDIADTALLDQINANSHRPPPQEQFVEIGSPIAMPD